LGLGPNTMLGPYVHIIKNWNPFNEWKIHIRTFNLL
jgi:hypothetical protein